MAKAPKVKPGGYDAAIERANRAKETYRISVKDTDPEFSFEYQPYNLPMSVRAHVRDVTGKTVELLVHGSEGRDVSIYCDVWWIARLAAGESVTRRQVQAEWDERFPGAVRTDITDELIEDSPEA
jgi:hypothetical protein